MSQFLENVARQEIESVKPDVEDPEVFELLKNIVTRNYEERAAQLRNDATRVAVGEATTNGKTSDG